MKHIVVILFVLVIPPSLYAANKPALKLSVGVMETIGSVRLEHQGLYQHISVSATQRNNSVGYTSVLGANVAPENGSWGLITGFNVDYAFLKNVSIDMAMYLLCDQPANQNNTDFYGGFGTGMSLFVNQLIISTSTVVFFKLSGSSVKIAPSLNVGYLFSI